MKKQQHGKRISIFPLTFFLISVKLKSEIGGICYQPVFS